MQKKDIVVMTGDKICSGQLTHHLRETFTECTTKTISAADIAGLNWANISAFVLPGIFGETSPYPEMFSDQDHQAIRDYVSGGGIFIGFCAGAYHACKDIAYSPPWGDQKTLSPKLDLFNACAKGPIPRPDPPEKGSTDTPCILTPILHQDKTIHVAYDFGPALHPYYIEGAGEDENIDVIARYEQTQDHNIAIAKKAYDKGTAVFVGVLPFIEPIETTHPQHNDFSNSLKPHENDRQILWNDIMDIIRAHEAQNTKNLHTHRPPDIP